MVVIHHYPSTPLTFGLMCSNPTCNTMLPHLLERTMHMHYGYQPPRDICWPMHACN